MLRIKEIYLCIYMTLKLLYEMKEKDIKGLLLK